MDLQTLIFLPSLLAIPLFGFLLLPILLIEDSKQTTLAIQSDKAIRSRL